MSQRVQVVNDLVRDDRARIVSVKAHETEGACQARLRIVAKEFHCGFIDHFAYPLKNLNDNDSHYH